MVKIQQTIIIGLGPIGRATLERLKERIVNKYEQLPAIKLIALDIANPAAGEAGLIGGESILGPTEYLELPFEVIKEQPKLAQDMFSWVPDRVVAYGPEWRRTRAAARVAFQVHAKDIINFLEFHLNQLGTVAVRDEMDSKGFEIHDASSIIVAGLSDVVGSALLVDATYLINRLYERVGLHVSNSALLYMPSLVPSDPIAEARAYATLKEISSFMDGRPYHCDYPNKFVLNSDNPPFDKGCFLIDTRNEKNFALHTQDEAVYLTAEWLFRSVTSSLKGRVDEHVAEKNSVRAANQFPPYNSLGLATFILPIDSLVEWSSTRLSHDLIQSYLLKAEYFSKVSARLSDYYNKTCLRPNELMDEKLRRGKDGNPIKLQNEYINRLNTVPYDQITSQVQATVDDIGKKVLPGLKNQINNNAKGVLLDVEEAIKAEIVSILQEWPVGGIRLASQFAHHLHQETQSFSKSLNRREAAFQARNRQQINNLSKLGPLLRNAAAGIPKIPILILACLGGIISPLLLTSIWIWQGLNASPVLAVLLIASTWLLVLASAFYAFWRTKNGIDEIRDRYVVELNKRFEVELSLALIQAAGSLYPDIVDVAKLEKERLDKFIQGLRDAARALRLRLDDIPLTGEIIFAMQRSVLTDESIAGLYDKYLGPGQAEPHLHSFIREKGELSRWLEKPLAVFKDELFNFGTRTFAGMRELRVEQLLNSRMTTQTKAEKLVRELEDKSAPLWSYDPFSLGEAYSPLVQVFVGMDGAANNEFRQNFTRVNQSTIFEAIDDPFSLVVTSVRCNMPLFGLNRMQEFRKHYLNLILNNGEPLHLEDDLALSSDIIQTPVGKSKLDPSTAMAVGFAFGLIIQEEGIYEVVDLKGNKTGKLTKERIDSAILLGADEKLMQSLVGNIQKTASKKGVKATIEKLKKYIHEATITKWEASRIEQYIALLKS
jgi:hypothetical protein